ncbi:host cell division inhibitor Icd-like protein [Pasteurella skyensis]|uniref:Host cell division inhibitor Icd-like protein n=1 Tax=Phocoenobacter skyensis TaxID=97481 RepID=A0AAJ6N8E8_9PAST|nr:host cell division inhibitor Icd-like protein [Pasteurella skyensis]MDP8161950.1 host cell division inhibitor Icd-like protein [Pasteurella skyensis]MDP8172106.1 host cell division inhibitor Icd-like protein [Pasteurella skyensis]MDP8176546.1 host cell division inhibitor Icd-like protein [Pasteurella skyensis]MDP8178434.1 host cell division inhibitor Icd-like protein [Pasteurella skyensis]MDP8182810.1 host cell division inhibitor Icd-like protein [Pasteurella skyensis]
MKLSKHLDNAMNYSKLSSKSNRLSLEYLAYSMTILADCTKKQVEQENQKDYIISVVAKSTTEPENSNIPTANSSTPFNRAFFVRSIRTPKENNYLNLVIIFLSMVACNGKGFALCYIPLVVVSQPVTRYRPNLRNKAVTLNNLPTELLAMIYLLLCVNRTKPTFNTEVVRIQAPNEDEARFKLTADYQLLAICGRINADKDTINNRTLSNKAQNLVAQIEPLKFNHRTQQSPNLNTITPRGIDNKGIRSDLPLNTITLKNQPSMIDNVFQLQGGIYA